MNTKLVSQWRLPKNRAEQLGLLPDIEAMTTQQIERDTGAFLAENDNLSSPLGHLLQTCFTKVSSEFNSERWIKLIDNIRFDKKAKGFWIINKDYGYYISGSQLADVEKEVNTRIGDKINQWHIASEAVMKCMYELSSAPFDISRGRPSLTSNYVYATTNKTVQARDYDSGYYGIISLGHPIPFLPIKNTHANARSIFIDAISKGFTPKSLKENQQYLTLLSLFHRKQDLFTKGRQQADAIIQQLIASQVESNIFRALLQEDKLRADITPYHDKLLRDTGQGHWSLWQDELETSQWETITLPDELVARDPKSSINDGIVGIDFGTKSTVVVYQKDNANIHPMRIGTGDLSKEVAAFHYENPTIMEFKDLGRFITDYNAQDHRPCTRWEDLTISHTAQNSMLGSESSQFNTFLDELKQWAGDKNRKLKVVGQDGTVIDLPAFLALADDDFNPIEIYAYYLGLYINNQNNGIYLDYILSFPVTYEVAIRKRIIASFERGLKKSLPAELGREAIDQLSVKQGASEPAAYALIALQEYGFAPEGDERVFYSVFDFGGGTTDFDFGIFREAQGAKERRFDYVIEHFGAGGDRYLGGENLLELLAFDIFKRNRSTLLAKSIQFERHPERDNFPGSERLISHSQEARINTKTLCEKLRPFWEERDDLNLSSGVLALNLSDINGVVQTGVELDIDLNELEQLLSDRIERGVENFFNAMRLAFSQSHRSLQDIDQVKIFLAGNASQSSHVTRLFDKHITAQQQEMELEPDAQSRFQLFPPLGGKDSSKEKRIDRPNGKTGVAFGLIESRAGGKVKVVDHNVTQDEIQFRFYLGENRKGRFKTVIDRGVPFNQWFEFIDASSDRFEIFYTEQPLSSTNQVPITDSAVKKRAVRLAETSDDGMVYLRVVSPTRIEYVVAKPEELERGVYLQDIQFLEL